MFHLNLYNEFVKIVGEKNVVNNQDAIKEAELTNYKTEEKILLIVKPGNVDELQKCLKYAKLIKQPLYVVSTGKNWGYGSRVPLKTNSVLIELTRFNNIVDFDEDLGYISVEPGVTFNQAYNFLRQKKSSLVLGTTGGSGEASMIGNALERGIGTGLYADRFNNSCSLEVLLPNGEIIYTGFEKYGNYKTSKVYKWGAGPYVDGIFSQSNLGIVLKMTFWLLPAPEYLSIIFYKLNKTDQFSNVIDTLRVLSMQGIIRPTFTLYNDLRVISSIMQFPFDKSMPGAMPSEILGKEIRDNSPLKETISAWNGEISIRSITEQHKEIQSQIIKDKLKDYVDDVVVMHISKKEIFDLYNFEENRKEKNNEKSLRNFLVRKYIGIPDESAINQAYWRKRTSSQLKSNPDKDKCGLIWICPVVPFCGKDILSVLSIISGTINSYSFEAAISLQCMSERAICVIASYSWDRNFEKEDEVAQECYYQVLKALNKNGYFSYRNTSLNLKLKENVDSLEQFLKSIKFLVDPDNILNAGKYIYI